MPNIATWWCGQPRDAPKVLARHRRAGHRRRLRQSGSGLPREPADARRDADAGATRAARRRHRRARRRLCRPGGRQSLDHAGLGRRQARCRGPSCCASMRRATPDGWTNHARRLLPHLRPRRCARRLDGRRRALGRRLGARRQAGRAMATLLPTRRRRRASAGSWAICRAAPPTISSGSAAISSAPKRRCASCAALAGRLIERRRGNASAGAIAHLARLLVAWGAAPRDGRRDAAGRDRASHAQRRELRLGAVARARRAARRLLHPRAALARHLAADRATGARASTTRKSARSTEAEAFEPPSARCRRWRRLSGPRPGKHEPRRRLALSRHRAARRARHQHLPLRAPFRRARRDRRRSRRAARPGRFADHLSLALSDRRRACAGARHGRCSIRTIRARSPSRSSASTSHLAALPALREDGMLEAPQRLRVAARRR